MLFIRNKTDLLRTDMRIRGGGWLLVSPEVEAELMRLIPFVTYTLDGDVIVGVEDDEDARNRPPDPPTPDPLADIDALTLEHEFRLTLLELGV